MEGHGFQTEFILSHGKPSSEWAHVSAATHERADGSGYHRRMQMPDLVCSILAVANEHDELTRSTPYRKPFTSKQTAEKLKRAGAGRKFLSTAVAAVLQAAGQPVKDATEALPFGLTRREAQVPSSIAKSEIASAPNISLKTADHHIQSICNKTDARTRPALRLALHRLHRRISLSLNGHLTGTPQKGDVKGFCDPLYSGLLGLLAQKFN